MLAEYFARSARSARPGAIMLVEHFARSGAFMLAECFVRSGAFTLAESSPDRVPLC